MCNVTYLVFELYIKVNRKLYKMLTIIQENFICVKEEIFGMFGSIFWYFFKYVPTIIWIDAFVYFVVHLLLVFRRLT